jgi:hypothetical protein
LITVDSAFSDSAFSDYTIKKAIGWACCTPLMASEVFDLPRASDGAGYDDHGNADYRNGQGNEAGCEA